MLENHTSEGAVNDYSKLSTTAELISKAYSGQIPVHALEVSNLNEIEVELFLVRELLFWRSVAVGAGMDLAAVLFDELHLAFLRRRIRS